MNALTVDVEDWYHDAQGLGGRVPAAPEARVDRNVRRLLDLFEARGVHATFFFLGEVAEKFPALVREARARGHEIASHGYRHRPLGSLLQREFRAEVRRSLALLSSLAGDAVRGFRAPYFSLKAGVRWPANVLAEEGFTYDSSILPIDRAPGLELVSPRSPYRLTSGVWEVPVAMPRYFFWHLPLLGGFALRLLPYGFVRRRFDEFNRELGPAVVHLHPWEVDAGGPEVESLSPVVRGLKTWGRGGLAAKLERLFGDYRFGSIAEVFPEVVSGSTPQARPSA